MQQKDGVLGPVGLLLLAGCLSLAHPAAAKGGEKEGWKRAGAGFYQAAPVTGTIRDEKGTPIQGVSVNVKGTNRTVVTDAAGRFTIEAGANDVLVFSSVGYVAKEVTIEGRSNIDYIMQQNVISGDEIVVVGYQTVRKRDLTGATSVVSAQNTQRLAPRSLPEQLQGMAAGVAVRTGGAPGQEAVVNIRGLSTINSTGNPLYVIDGVFSDPNTTVNSNDVESIQILKDASAAAIYGSRAGNGVIIITTKKGREGPLKVSASAKYSVSMIPKTYDMMNASEYVATAKAAYQNSGFTANLPVGIANYNGNVNTDWADLLLKKGHIQDYNVTVSGGGKSANVLISGSYFKDEGALLGQNFERAALRINSEATRGRFKVTENLMLSNSNRHSPQEGNFEVGNPWHDVWNTLPILPVQGSSFVSTANPGGYGIGNSDIPTYSRNYVAINDLWKVKSNFFKALGNIYLDVKLTDFLSYRFNIAGETSLDHTNNVRKVGIFYWNQSEKPSSVDENRGQFLSYMTEHTLNFNKRFDKHTIAAVVGESDQTAKSDYSTASRTNLAVYGGNYFTTINSATGANGASGAKRTTYTNSYFGRLNYNYSDKYFASFTFRSDKDSRFSKVYRRGFFPSGAVSWRVSNEDFFTKGFISDLKLRGSYGILGLPGLDPYQFTGFLNQGTRAIFGVNQQEFVGGYQARLVYENLKWEEKATANIGVDAAFLNNSITATVDVFRSKTSDVLIELPIAGFLGSLGGYPVVNIGSIENKGVELELGYRPRMTGDFRWNVAANFSVIRNKVLDLGNLGIDPVTGKARNYITSGNTRTQVGHSIGEYYVLRTDGIFQTQDEINKHKAQAAYAKPGDIRFRNIVDGGSNDDINDQDREFAGSPWPKLITGLQGNLSYKAFSLNIQLYGAFGQKLFNDVLTDLDGMGYSNYRTGLNYWTPTNTNTSTPRLGVSYAINGVSDRGIQSNVRGNSDRWIEDGSYLRLRNLELGYTFSKGLLDRAHLGDARIFISGQNLLTLTGYSGLDPDVVGANANLEPGVDIGRYPASRIISVGLNVGF